MIPYKVSGPIQLVFTQFKKKRLYNSRYEQPKINSRSYYKMYFRITVFQSIQKQYTAKNKLLLELGAWDTI